MSVSAHRQRLRCVEYGGDDLTPIALDALSGIDLLQVLARDVRHHLEAPQILGVEREVHLVREAAEGPVDPPVREPDRDAEVAPDRELGGDGEVRRCRMRHRVREEPGKATGHDVAAVGLLDRVAVEHRDLTRPWICIDVAEDPFTADELADEGDVESEVLADRLQEPLHDDGGVRGMMRVRLGAMRHTAPFCLAVHRQTLPKGADVQQDRTPPGPGVPAAEGEKQPAPPT